MSTGLFAHKVSDRPKGRRKIARKARVDTFSAFTRITERRALYVVPRQRTEELSPWSQCVLKRVFDCVCVLLMLPIALPILLIVALMVWMTSSGPVLFLQKRVGCGGHNFTIIKFRTIVHEARGCCHAVSTAENQPFTAVGPFLRRWKLDELPQIFNVLIGHMSLVGPRPKMPEHVTTDLCCRPGITGAATISFACEERVLDRVPRHQLNAYYHQVILPAKLRLDAEYMARATFASDFKLIMNSLFRRWDGSVVDALLQSACFEAEETQQTVRVQIDDPISIGSTGSPFLFERE